MMMDITYRENTKLWLDKKRPQWLPQLWAESTALSSGCINEKPLTQDGYDWFGIHWTYEPTAPGGGAPAVTPGQDVNYDLTKWKQQIQFPDLEALPWEKDGEIKKKNADPNRMVIIRNSGGPYERAWQIFGFGSVLEGLLDEPEATYDFMAAVADFKIAMYKKVFKYYGPVDIIWQADDWGHQHSGFFSEPVYKKMVWPHAKKIADFAKGEGVYYFQHSCGNNSFYLDDMIEAGFHGWEAQANANDIPKIAETRGTDLLISTNLFDFSDGNIGESEAIDKVREVLDLYAPLGSVTTGINTPRRELTNVLQQEYREYSGKILAALH
jgi:hypothetical protein